MNVLESGVQQTIKNSVSYTGIALHSGQEVNIELKPAPDNTGIVFRRIDIDNAPEIRARPGNVYSTNRSTTLGINKGQRAIKIGTVEHIMAALWSSGIDNIFIELDGPELPIGDGSAYLFVQLLEKAGVCQLQFPRKVFVIDKPYWVQETGATNSQIVILPDSGFKISYTLDFEHPAIGTQLYEFDADQNSFIQDIARARTFGFKEELDDLHNRGLARGGSLENAILIADDKIVNSLRFKDELVRHKILDVIGDMALTGFIQGRIVAIKSGHKLQVQLLKKIQEQRSE